MASLSQCCNDCLTMENKTAGNYQFFKNNILDSGVWSLRGKDGLLFDKVRQSVIEDDVKKQQIFIEQSIKDLGNDDKVCEFQFEWQLTHSAKQVGSD